MKNIKVKDIINLAKAKLIMGDENLACENFCKDTRLIKEGDIYIAIKGQNFDGNLFWKEALEKGAKAVIVQDIDFEKEDLSKFEEKTIIEVKDVLETLYRIAKFKRELYDIPVVAITGSVGKTSTKDIVANVVKEKYNTLKTEGNNNNNIGLPFTVLRLKEENAMVLEMGMNHFGEISLLTHIAKPTVCVITNIGTSHIGNLGSRENILKAKLEILEGTKNPIVVINNDNDLLHKWYEENKEKDKIISFGIENKSDIMAQNVKLYEEYSEFSTNIDGKSFKIKVPVGGEHFVLNSLCSICVGKALEIENEKIVDGIEKFELTKNRMDIEELKDGIKVINDAYNASYESMKMTLKYISEIKANRKIAVLGDMFELGEFSEELHKKVGEEVVKNNIDILICSGENSKNIIETAKNQGMKPENIYYFENKEDILNLLEKIVEPQDVILFKASNGMQFYKLAVQIKTILNEK